MTEPKPERVHVALSLGLLLGLFLLLVATRGCEVKGELLPEMVSIGAQNAG